MDELREFNTSKSCVCSYLLRSLDGQRAKCKSCQKVLTCAGGSISALRNLKTRHNLTLNATSIDANAVASTSNSNPHTSSEETRVPKVAKPDLKQRKITDYFKKKLSMEMTLTQMVTLDGLTFKVFVNSVDLVYLFKNGGYTLPESANAIRSIVLKECDEARIKVIRMLTNFKKEGYKLSLTVDEWSSTRNRRYIHINLYSPHLNKTKKPISLGLVRILPSATAAKITSLIEERLKSFNMNFEDVVGLTTDGASIMVKIGKGLPVYHQLCYAQALQLAVLDVLYETDETFELEYIAETQLYNHLDDESDSDESDNDGMLIISPTTKYQTELQNTQYKPLIDRMRKVAKMFRKSSTKNYDLLQKYVTEDFGKDISLIIDCKTKWSSLCSMIERFIKLYPSVQKALIDLNSNIRFNNDEILLLKHAHEVLEIVRNVMEILCQEDATLLTADTALKEMFEKLQNMSTPGDLSGKLLEALQKRIENRYILIQGVLKYLHLPQEFFDEPQSHIFLKPTPDTIKAIVTALVTGTDASTTNSTMDKNALAVIDVPISTPDSLSKLTFKSLKDELLYNVAADSGPITSAAFTAISTSICEADCVPQMVLFEMALLENGGQRGKYLSKAYQQLMSVKPTSIDAKRAFSTARYFCSKLRSRLSDSTLDALMFLRSYIISKKKQ